MTPAARMRLHVQAAIQDRLTVFPVNANGKEPPEGFSWPKRASRDAALVDQWWPANATGEPHNIGIHLGSGIAGICGGDKPGYMVVLDLDVKHGKDGVTKLQDLAREAGAEIPETRTVRTPSGGLHLYFIASRPLSNSSPWGKDGIDIRGVVGYVLAPGSMIDGKPYMLEKDLQSAPLPDWIDKGLTVKTDDDDVEPAPLAGTINREWAHQWAEEFLEPREPVLEGGRNPDAYKVALTLKARGVARNDCHGVMETMLKHVPPLDSAELTPTINSAYKKKSVVEGSLNPAAVFKPIPRGLSGSSYVDFGSLAYRDPPPREWVVDEWIPRRAVTVLFGPGGHGKSLLAQQLASAVEAGKPWLGKNAKAGPVIGIFCEDDADEMLRRGKDIQQSLFIEPAAQSKGLFLDARAGKPNCLVTFGSDRLPRRTELFNDLNADCARIKPALIILDNIAQIFAGQENARAEVTPFVNLLTSLACEHNCAVLLLGHTAKAEGSEYSGSTAWDAAVRSRLLLERGEDGYSVLKKLKANYSSLDEIRLEWRNGAFHALPAHVVTSPEVVAAHTPLILEALQTLTHRQQATSHTPSSSNFLIRLMVAENVIGKRQAAAYRAALNALIASGQILVNQELPWRTVNRHAARGLKVAV